MSWHCWLIDWSNCCMVAHHGGPLYQHGLTQIIILVRHKKARFDTKIPVLRKNTWFNRKMPDSREKCPTQHASIAIAIIKHLPPSSENFFYQFYSNILFSTTHREIIYEKWNHIYIQIYLISLWNMKCNYSFLFLMIIMSAAINKCHWYGSIILPTSALLHQNMIHT